MKEFELTRVLATAPIGRVGKERQKAMSGGMSPPESPPTTPGEPHAVEPGSSRRGGDSSAESDTPQKDVGVGRSSSDGTTPDGASHAGKLLALRESLTEKELRLLEMQQTNVALVDKNEELTARLKRERRAKADLAKLKDGAVKSKDEAAAAAELVVTKMKKLRSELKVAREATSASRAESAEYRDKWMDEKRSAAASQAAAAKAQELVQYTRDERAEARNERDTARTESANRLAEVQTLRAQLMTARREAEEAREEAKSASSRLNAVKTAANAELNAVREELEAMRRHAAEEQDERERRREEAHARTMMMMKESSDEQVKEARAQAAEARAQAAEQTRVAREAVSKAQLVAQAQSELKAKTEILLERVRETTKHAEGRASAATRHKAATREAKRQLAEARSALARAAEMKAAGPVNPAARDAVQEAFAILSGAMKQCFDHGDKSELLQQWLAGNGERKDVDGSALLAMAHRAAGALVTATTRAEEAERELEEARSDLENVRLELAATDAEHEATLAAMARETAVAGGWEDAAARAESTLAAMREELRTAKAAAAAAEERANRGKDELRMKMDRVSVWDAKKTQLNTVIARMHNRSLRSPLRMGAEAKGNVGVNGKSAPRVPGMSAERSTASRRRSLR